MLTDTVRVSVNSNIFVFFLTRVFGFMYRKVQKTENENVQNVDVGGIISRAISLKYLTTHQITKRLFYP